MQWQFRRKDSTAWHGVIRLTSDNNIIEEEVVMAKSKTFPQTDAGTTNPRPMSAEQHAHFRSLVGHTLESAAYSGHGHATGKSATGKMVASHSHLQGGQYLPQGALQNRQNMSSDGAGSACADPAGSDDYGKVDAGA